METHDVVNFLLKKGFQVTPDAIDHLKIMNRLEFQGLVKRIIKSKNRNNVRKACGGEKYNHVYHN